MDPMSPHSATVAAGRLALETEMLAALLDRRREVLAMYPKRAEEDTGAIRRREAREDAVASSERAAAELPCLREDHRRAWDTFAASAPTWAANILELSRVPGAAYGYPEIPAELKARP